MGAVSDAAIGNQRSVQRQQEEKPEQILGFDPNRKKIKKGYSVLLRKKCRKNGQNSQNASRCADHRIVSMAWQKPRAQHLNNSAQNSRCKIDRNEFHRTQCFLDRPPKKIENETIAQNVPGPGRHMQKLEREELPDFPMANSIQTQCQVRRRMLKVEFQQTLPDKCHDQQYDQRNRQKLVRPV